MRERRRVDRSILLVAAVALFAALAFLAWISAEVLLLVFAGVLLAVFLRGLADLLGKLAGLGRNWSLALTLLLLAAVLALVGLFLGAQIAEQLDQLGPRPDAAGADMHAQLINDSPEKTFALILENGEEAVAAHQRFAEEHGLAASRFTAIGGSREHPTAVRVARPSEGEDAEKDAEDQHDQEDHDEDEEEHPRDRRGPCRDTCEAEYAGNHGDQEEDDGPLKHAGSPSVVVRRADSGIASGRAPSIAPA